MKTDIFEDSSSVKNAHSPDLQNDSIPPSASNLLMDASILVLGESEFLETFLERYETLATHRVVASSIGEAIAVLQKQKPDLLIAQANVLMDFGAYRILKQQSNSEGLYCLVVGEPRSSNRQAERSRFIHYAKALENGADAYLELTTENPTWDEIELMERLLRAQIQVGLTQVKKFRDLIQTNDVLSAIALADPLTEASNRRALEWDLPRQIQNARRHQTPLSLIMLDVDRFKAVNDNHGHLVGDRVLQMLTARLRDRLRLQDTIFRYGGEEFAVLLQQTDLEAAKVVAERLRKAIDTNPFPCDRHLTLAISISLGLAELQPTDDLQGQSLLARADGNLLTAKATGRNRIICS